MSEGEGELYRKLKSYWDNDDATGREFSTLTDEIIDDVLDEAKADFYEVLKDGETRLDEIPALIKKWFGVSAGEK